MKDAKPKVMQKDEFEIRDFLIIEIFWPNEMSRYRRKVPDPWCNYWLAVLKQRAVDWTLDAKCQAVKSENYEFENREF